MAPNRDDPALVDQHHTGSAFTDFTRKRRVRLGQLTLFLEAGASSKPGVVTAYG